MTTVQLVLRVCIFLFPGPEGGVCEAADPCVRLGAAEPDPERSVPAACQNVRPAILPGADHQHFELLAPQLIYMMLASELIYGVSVRAYVYIYI